MTISSLVHRHSRNLRRRDQPAGRLLVPGWFVWLGWFLALAWPLLVSARPAGAAVAAGTVAGNTVAGNTVAAGAFGPPLPMPLSVLGKFALPSQPWLAGNRGVDLVASAGEPVLAAASGVVVYAGELAGRGVISISHGTLRTTYEPVDPVVHAGDAVTRGEVIGHVSAAIDGCGPPGGCLHWGARIDNSYVDPMGLLGAARPRLLPIWLAGVPLPNWLPAPFRRAAQTRGSALSLLP